MNLKEQGIFLTRCSEMLNNGFNLLEVLIFLSRLSSHEHTMQAMIHDLQKGDSLYEVFLRNHFDKQVCAQIYFAEKHGYFAKSIHEAGTYLLRKDEGQKKLVKLLQYPLILMVTLFIVAILLNTFLLPRLQILYTSMSNHTSLSITFILHLLHYIPYYFLLICVFVITIVIFLKRHARKKSALDIATFYSKLPFINSFYTLYQTVFLAREWSNLLRSGCSISEIITIMEGQTFQPLLREIALELKRKLLIGSKLSDALSSLGFLEKELLIIVAHGENNGRLENELQFYSNICMQKLEEKITKIFFIVQPIIFLMIGILIIAIYMAIFLPMFQMMESI